MVWTLTWWTMRSLVTSRSLVEVDRMFEVACPARRSNTKPTER